MKEDVEETLNEFPFHKVDAWYGPDLDESQWIFDLTAEEIQEIEVAADRIVELSISTPREICLDMLMGNDFKDFELPIFRKFKGLRLTEALQSGLGFFVLRGLTIGSMSKEKIAAIFLIICRQFGTLRMQNAAGHVLGHVTDLGLESTNPNVRIYQTRERQTFHTDSSDVVGLMCLKQAKEGGDSSVVHNGAIFNEMLKRAPELCRLLFAPIPTDRRGEVPPGAKPYYMIPVFSYFDNNLTTIYQRQYIDSSQRFEDAPRLQREHFAALNMFDALADDPALHLKMRLHPGDMQFVHNHTLLHDRTAFTDHDDPALKRHLLRAWITTPVGRALPPVFAERFGSVTIGDRGGVNIPGTTPVAPVCPVVPSGGTSGGSTPLPSPEPPTAAALPTPTFALEESV